MKNIKGFQTSSSNLEAHAEGVKIGDREYSLRIVNYLPEKKSKNGALDIMFVEGPPIDVREVVYQMIIDENGIKFNRKRMISAGGTYIIEFLKKVINPRAKDEKKGDLVWMSDSPTFKKDYEIFYVPFGRSIPIGMKIT